MRPNRITCQIMETLTAEGEIISVFNFTFKHGFYDYRYALGVFKMLAENEVIKLTRHPGKGNPWRVTPGRNFHHVHQ
jgi:hypothetical protein